MIIMRGIMTLTSLCGNPKGIVTGTIVETYGWQVFPVDYHSGT
jgi:hypothetical protein